MNHSIRHYICFTIYVTVCPTVHANNFTKTKETTNIDGKEAIHQPQLAVHPLNMQINHPSAVH